MSTDQAALPTTRVEVRNVGGIETAAVTLSPGVSVLTGRNATNRTSFLQALMAGLGSERSSLKGDADEGEVTLEVGEETYTRTLTRRGETVAFGGDPYLDDPEIADLFAFLLENNEARRAVARGDDLREVIMRPIDTDRIEAEIESRRRERDEVEAELDRLDEVEREIAELEADRRETREELADAREELADARDELAALDAGVEESRSRKRELEDAFERVRDARSELEDLEFDLETERSTLAELEAERDELEGTLEESEAVTADPDRLAGRLDELRRRKRSLDETIGELSSVISFNEEMLAGDGLDVDGGADSASAPASDGAGPTNGPTSDGTDPANGPACDGADPTDALVDEGETVCWTCGSAVEPDQIEATVDDLRDLHAERLDERSEVRAEIDDLTDERSEIQRAKRERRRTEERLSEVEDDVEATRDRIDDLESAVEAKREELAELEAAAEDVDVEGHDEALDRHREITEIELRTERLESAVEDLDAEIDDREAAVAEREELREERDRVAERLTELRTRVDRIEGDAVEAFNDHMETVLGILEYENLDRIWIERREAEVREGRRTVSRTEFDLHVVRSTADGTAYEDTVDHLSESEREVTGLVFALAGYLVHDVHETVPFILLDSLEAIDSDRIARVVDYFRDHADYLVTALLPEDAAALSDDYAYVESID